MRNALAWVLALAVTLALAACGSPADSGSVSDAAASEIGADDAPVEEDSADAAPAAVESSAVTCRIGVAADQLETEYMQSYCNELKTYFETLGSDAVQYDVTVADAGNDADRQREQVEGLIARGMNVIFLDLVPDAPADEMIDAIVAADIPLLLINREPPGDGDYAAIVEHTMACYVGADARQAGTLQGEIIAELPDRGDLNGDGRISYIMIEGAAGDLDAQYRSEYSIRALTDAGCAVECLDAQSGNWDRDTAREICAADLAEFGDAVEVVFCGSDAMALGAAEAVADAGRTVGKDIYLVGVDGLAECVRMVNEGTMTGTVLNDSVLQSRIAAEVAIAALNDEEMQNYYWVDCVKVVR